MLNYLSVVFYLYVIVRKFIHLISLRISQTFFELSVSNNAISHFRHMVVLIGDGFSEGVGGSGTRKGLGVELEKLKAATEKSFVAQRGHSWTVASLGEEKTTAMDLVRKLKEGGEEGEEGRSCSVLPSSVASLGEKPLLVLSVGAQDIIHAHRTSSSPSSSIPLTIGKLEEDIKQVVEHLARVEGYRVVLAGLSFSGGILGKYKFSVKGLNKALANWAKAEEQKEKDALEKAKSRKERAYGHKEEEDEEEEEEDEEEVKGKIRFCAPSAHALRDEFKCFDGLHFNQKGYALFARDVYGELEGLMREVEWEHTKAMLREEDEAT